MTLTKFNKSGQIEVTFNWVYILIAGAIILLFFIGIVVKQKTVSEERLAIDVVDLMDSIFTGASVSEKTKQPLDTSGLADYTLFFDCSEGVGTFGIKDQAASQENAIQPLFAPHELQTSRLLLWSLPYYLPYKVIDFLFVTSINTKYILIGNTPFAEEFLEATEPDQALKWLLNRELIQLQDLNKIDPGNNFQVRLIDLNGLVNTLPVPEKLQFLDDDKVTMVAFLDDGKKVNYYQKEDNTWKWLNRKEGPIQIISLGGEKDAAKYAAIFSADDKVYKCNMGKAFQRLEYLTEIYGGKDIYRGTPGGKLKEMIDYYTERPEEEAVGEPCLDYLQVLGPNLLSSLRMFQNQVQVCQSTYQSGSQCSGLVSTAEEIRQLNQNLGRRGDCLTLY